jgi:excisionase family DNA binding protein
MEPRRAASLNRSKPPGPDWYTPETLAKRLKVSERTVRNWVRRGELPSYKIGSSRRFDPVDVDAFLANFRQEGKEPR